MYNKKDEAKRYSDEVFVHWRFASSILMAVKQHDRFVEAGLIGANKTTPRKGIFINKSSAVFEYEFGLQYCSFLSPPISVKT